MKSREEYHITDGEISEAFESYHFGRSIDGDLRKMRKFIAFEAIKSNAGWYNGASVCDIMRELGIFSKGKGPYDLKAITKRGRVFIYDTIYKNIYELSTTN